MIRLGIMGGTFDPIHYGHLVAAAEARHVFELDRVTFVPSRQPPHKREAPAAGGEHRYAMTVAATCSNPRFDASRIELERAGPSYTLDTLRALRAVDPTAELFFITGADAVRELRTWRQPEQLVELCRFVAVTRPGYDLDGLERDLGALARAVSAIEAPGVDISSTQIRERVAQGRSIKYLTPEPVEVYIAKHGLYRAGSSQSEKKGGDSGCRLRSTSGTCPGV
jgi:nicotinate-nucleotide adenylyltransferase